MRNQLTSIDLFAGCGGLSLGLEQAGYKVIAGVDISKTALATFQALHPHAQAIHADLSDTDRIREILQQIGPVDLITITAPCAPFSSSLVRTLIANNYAGLRGFSAPKRRADFFLRAIRWL